MPQVSYQIYIPEVKTEEGYSADIHISLEIYVRTMSAQHLTKDICLTRDICCEMLCGHVCLPTLYPSSVFSSADLVRPLGPAYANQNYDVVTRTPSK